MYLAPDGIGIGVSSLENFCRSHQCSPLLDGIRMGQDQGLTRAATHVSYKSIGERK